MKAIAVSLPELCSVGATSNPHSPAFAAREPDARMPQEHCWQLSPFNRMVTSGKGFWIEHFSCENLSHARTFVKEPGDLLGSLRHR